MIFVNLKNSFVSAAALLVLAGTAVPVLAAPVKNIVVVHGAFADGSGWKPVYDILVKDGYSVTVVQEPLTSLEEDVATTKRILDRQTGACILVGHKATRDNISVVTNVVEPGSVTVSEYLLTPWEVAG
jgi:hypothetical protein